MKALVLSSVVLCCLGLSGCTANSVQPLYTSSDAVAEPALVGTWVDAKSDDKSELRIQKADDQGYSLVLSGFDSKVVQNYKVNLVRLGDQLYADVQFKDQTINDTKIDDPLGAVSTHLIVKIKVTGDDLAYSTLDVEAIKKQNGTESLPLAFVENDSDMVVTAKTADLRRYVSVHTSDVFSDAEHLKRKVSSP